MDASLLFLSYEISATSRLNRFVPTFIRKYGPDKLSENELQGSAPIEYVGRGVVEGDNLLVHCLIDRTKWLEKA